MAACACSVPEAVARERLACEEGPGVHPNGIPNSGPQNGYKLWKLSGRDNAGWHTNPCSRESFLGFPGSAEYKDRIVRAREAVGSHGLCSSANHRCVPRPCPNSDIPFEPLSRSFSRIYG